MKKKRLGFGSSLIKALKLSKHEYCCIFDGDNSFDPNSLELMMKKLEHNYDFVFCSRYKDGNVSEDDTFIRKLGNFFFTKIVNVLFNIKTTDVLFLYVMGEKKKFLSLELKSRHFNICTEILLKCYLNFKCSEVISLEKKRKYGVSKVNAFIDGLKILINIFHYYIKRFFNDRLI